MLPLASMRVIGMCDCRHRLRTIMHGRRIRASTISARRERVLRRPSYSSIDTIAFREQLSRRLRDVAPGRRLVQRTNERGAGESRQRPHDAVRRQGFWRGHPGRVPAGNSGGCRPAAVCRGPADPRHPASGVWHRRRIEGSGKDATGAAPHVSESDRFFEHRRVR